MQPKYGMVIDASRCINCKACIVACQMENNVPPGLTRDWIKETPIGHGMMHFQPGNCMHCEEPTCVEVCPADATFKIKDGRVIIDPSLCIGCELCIPACPYGARFLHPTKGIADKCDFCNRRLKLGLEPACVVICPMRTRIFGDFNDPSSEVGSLLNRGGLVRVINPKFDTKPNIYYFDNTTPLNWPVEPEFPDPGVLEEIREEIGA